MATSTSTTTEAPTSTSTTTEAPTTTTTEAPTTTTTTLPPPTCQPKTPIIGGNPVGLSLPTAGWYTSDTRSQGFVAVSDNFGDPTDSSCNAAVMVTGVTTGSPAQDKAQLLTYAIAGTPLSDITDVGYSTYKSSLSTGNPAVDATINILVTPGPVTSYPAAPITYLVFEPYMQSAHNAGILIDTWQDWDATSTNPGDGVWWSNGLSGTGDQNHPIPWAQMQAMYPGYNVVAYGLNLGSVNPGSVVAADHLRVNATTTDF